MEPPLINFPTRVWEPVKVRVEADGTETELWASRQATLEDHRRRRDLAELLSGRYLAGAMR